MASHVSAAAVPSSPDLPTLQRAQGSLRLLVEADRGRTRVSRLRQQGCLKLLQLRASRHAYAEMVVLNTAGGIAGGDSHDISVACGHSTALVVTGQASERCYRARCGEGPAFVATSVTMQEHSRLEWLPQDLILFDGAALHRRFDVTMPRSATLLCVESRVFGRIHSGEKLRSLSLYDRMSLYRDGSPALVDALRMKGDAATLLARMAIGGGATAAAIIVFAAPEMFLPAQAALRLAAVRTALEGEEAGASAWNGFLVARLVGRDSLRHRAAVLRVLAVLRDERAPPSIWRC